MPPPKKKRIEHDEIVQRFGKKLQEVRLRRAMTQAGLAQQASCTTNYISRLEKGGAAPGIDLVARLAKALNVTLAELLPTDSVADELDVTRERAQGLFDELIASNNPALLVVLTQMLARLSEATNG